MAIQRRGILVIGESLIDIVRRPGEPAVRHPGGSCMNVAVGLGRLGYRPTLATWIGDDDDGRAIARHCARSGVVVLPGSTGAARTSTADASLDADGHATYTFDMEWRMPVIPKTNRYGIVHVGSLGSVLEPGGTDVWKFIETNRRHSFVTFDPNCRPTVMGERREVFARVAEFVALSDLVKVSDEDLAWLYPGIVGEPDFELLAEIAADWCAKGPTVVVVTMGARGALAVSRTGASVRVDADTTRPVVDTVGAGDALTAGLIHGLLDYGFSFPRDRAKIMRDPLHFGTILGEAIDIAGITVSRPGADPPWREELRAV